MNPVYTMQVVNLEDIDYPWDEFTERTDLFNGAFVAVHLDSDYTDKRLVNALRKAGITDSECLVYVSW